MADFLDSRRLPYVSARTARPLPTPYFSTRIYRPGFWRIWKKSASSYAIRKTASCRSRRWSRNSADSSKRTFPDTTGYMRTCVFGRNIRPKNSLRSEGFPHTRKTCRRSRTEARISFSHPTCLESLPWTWKGFMGKSFGFSRRAERFGLSTAKTIWRRKTTICSANFFRKRERPARSTICGFGFWKPNFGIFERDTQDSRAPGWISRGFFV